MGVPFCDKCGAAVDRVAREIDGKLTETYPKFCRKCGGSVSLREEAGGRNGLDAEGQLRNFDSNFNPNFNSIGDFDSLTQAIESAIPDDFTTLTREELHQSIVRAVREQLCNAPGVNTELRTQVRGTSGGLEKPKIPSRELPRMSSAELKRPPSRELDARAEGQRTRPSMLSGRCSFGAPPVSDDRREERLASYHVSSLAGLTSHARWTPEEAEELGAQLAKRRYTVQPCDCDRVRYIPSATHPGYIERAEETVKK